MDGRVKWQIPGEEESSHEFPLANRFASVHFSRLPFHSFSGGPKLSPAEHLAQRKHLRHVLQVWLGILLGRRH